MKIKPCEVLFFITLLSINLSAALNAKISVTKTELNTFLQEAQAGPEAKLVFISNQKFYYIDFSSETLEFKEIKSASTGELPVISPDGKYCVFTKGASCDGEKNSPCTSYICPIEENGVPIQVASPAYAPRFVQNAANPTVLYSTCATTIPPESLLTFNNNCGSVLKREFVNGQFDAPKTVWTKGSFFGGLSYDEKYLGTAWLGSGKAYMCNIGVANPAIKMTYFKIKNSQTNSDSIFTIGACNPSISSSRVFTDAMMFVDFGFDKSVAGNYALPFGKIWDQHEYIIITNYNADLYRYIGQKYKPELSYDDYMALSYDDTKGQSFKSVWDFPEWSNHPYLAIATVAVSRTWKKGTEDFEETVNREHIYLINLKTSKTLPLVSTPDTLKASSTSFLWPWFWTKVSDNFVEEKDWLKLDHQQSIKKSKNILRNNSTHLTGSTLKSEKLIKEASAYLPDGRCIWKSSAPGKTFSLPEHNITGKTVILHITYFDASSESFRFIRTK
jgi:hypothetical protein